MDLLGTGAFAAVAAFTLQKSPTSYWSSLAVVMWSLKLSTFLLVRVCHHGGHDNRLNETLGDPVSAASFWTISWLWGVVVSLPHCLGAASRMQPISSLSFEKTLLGGGLLLFAVGWTIETVADYQKWMFKQQHDSSTYCHVGLWSWSQHPNWCGNLLLWMGIWMINVPAMVGPHAKVQKVGRLALSCLGPLFLLALFHGQATGWILPSALEATKQRYGYGTDLEYTHYVDQTPLLFPWTSTK